MIDTSVVHYVNDEWARYEFLRRRRRVCQCRHESVQDSRTCQKGDIVYDNYGQWYEVKDVRRDDGFIAIRRASGAWEYRDPKDFKKHA